MIGDHTIEAREVPLGGLRRLVVSRTLPSRGLPAIGAWCFLDHFGPTDEVMQVLPHPHIGLQTVTWPFQGRIRHRDSLGNDIVVRPGELNLMTSGDGVSHSEFSVLDEEGRPEPLHGVQLWAALPDGVRGAVAGFEHRAELPRVRSEGWSAIVLVGEFAGQRSHAVVHTPLMAAQLRLAPGRHAFALDRVFEHGVLAVDGAMDVDGERIERRDLRYLATGRERIEISVTTPTTVMIFGGRPFEADLVMWWNFIGRDHEEIIRARADWEAQSARFGHVDGHGGQVIPAPPMPPLRLLPRRRRCGETRRIS